MVGSDVFPIKIHSFKGGHVRTIFVGKYMYKYMDGMGIIITMTIMSVNMPGRLGIWILFRGNPKTVTKHLSPPTEETFSLRHGTHGHGAEATDGEGTKLGTSGCGYGAGTFFLEQVHKVRCIYVQLWLVVCDIFLWYFQTFGRQARPSFQMGGATTAPYRKPCLILIFQKITSNLWSFSNQNSNLG